MSGVLITYCHLQERFVIELHFRLPFFLERTLTISFPSEKKHNDKTN